MPYKIVKRCFNFSCCIACSNAHKAIDCVAQAKLVDTVEEKEEEMQLDLSHFCPTAPTMQHRMLIEEICKLPTDTAISRCKEALKGTEKSTFTAYCLVLLSEYEKNKPKTA